MGLKSDDLASESTHAIEKGALRQQQRCAHWEFPQPARVPDAQAGTLQATDSRLDGLQKGH